MIKEILSFYTILGRALTPHELWLSLPKNERPENFHAFLILLHKLEKEDFVEEKDGLVFVKKLSNPDIIRKRKEQNEILEKKWSLILRYRKVFNLVPFLDFALLSGSLSLEAVSENSDFDIVIGCKKGRIFTVRFFIILFFGLLGIRRKGTHSKKESINRFCFNHFITPENYKLNPPYHTYWQELYKRMVPLYGDEDAIISFFKANDWSGRGVTIFDNRYLPKKFNLMRKILEIFLFGPIGNFFEHLFKRIQMKRILKKMPSNVDARICVNDNELEFHPDQERFKKVLIDVKDFS